MAVSDCGSIACAAGVESIRAGGENGAWEAIAQWSDCSIMAIRVVRLGSPRHKGEGLRIGTVRRPPRGVRKSEYAAKDIYDLWFPNLSPSEALLKEVVIPIADDRAWRSFRRRFLAEMKSPQAGHDLDLLAALSHQTNFAIGCYCEDEATCHRSILRDLLIGRGADVK